MNNQRQVTKPKYDWSYSYDRFFLVTVTARNAIHPVGGQVRIVRLRGPKPGLQGLPIVTQTRNTMSFDGRRVERIRGLPCRDNIGELATLEGRLEKKQKTNKNGSKESPLLITTRSHNGSCYNNVTKVAQALLIKQNKQKTKGEITIPLQEAA